MMLLDTFISTELEVYKASKENITILERLLGISDILDNRSFKLVDLTDLGYSKELAMEVIDSLKGDGLVEEMISIDCFFRDETDELNNLTEICPICKGVIEEENHEVEPLYFVKTVGRELRGKLIKHISSYFINEEYRYNYNELKKIMSDNKIIPFIGAGMSKPLGAPGWTDLFLLLGETISFGSKGTYESYVRKGKFFDAIKVLYEFSNTIKTDTRLREKAAEIIEDKINYDSAYDTHNYNDLLDLDFPYYLTTNYDNALNHCQRKFSAPLQIEDIENIQSFLGSHKSKVVHLHGIVDKPSTMVLTEDDYKNKYKIDTSRLKEKLTALMSSKSLLFLGFSFSDQYFDELYNFIQESVGGTHFLVTHRITDEQNERLIKQNIMPILLDTNGDEELIFAIRYFLKSLKY